MKRSAWLAVAAATCVIILLTRDLPRAASLWCALLMAPLPALMVLQARQLAQLDAPLPRNAAYISSIASLWALALATAAMAAMSQFDAADLGIITVTAARFISITILLTLGAIGIQFLFRALGANETEVLRALLPQSVAERWLFVAVSATAGICEELIFRGFLQHALTQATSSPWIALVLASGTFGIVHAYQSSVGALRATLLGFLLGIPVVLGYGILPSIAAHTLVDILSGIVLARWLLR